MAQQDEGVGLGSGDLLVALLALERGLVDPGQLEQLTDQVLGEKARGRPASILSLLVDKGHATSGQAAELKRARLEAGRLCSACGVTTYLLPGEDANEKACEKCKRSLAGAPPPTEAASGSGRVSGAGRVSGEGRVSGSGSVAPGAPAGRVIAPAGQSDRVPGPPPPPRPSERVAQDPASAPTAYVAPPGRPTSQRWAPASQYAPQEPEPLPPSAFAPPAAAAAPRFAPEVEAAAPPPPLWSQLGEILTIPFQSGSAIAITGLGAVFLFLGIEAATSGALIFGLVMLAAMIPVMGMVLRYFARVTEAGMKGEKELPDFPELLLFDLVMMFLRYLGASFACYWPMAVFLLFFLAMQTKVALGLMLIGWVVTQFVGTLYWPIAWLQMVSYQNWTACFDYRGGLRAILVAPVDYLLLLLISFFVLIALVVFQVMAAVLPWPLSGAFSSAVVFAGALVLATATGRFYYANADRIGWFARSKPKAVAPSPRTTVGVPGQRPGTQGLGDGGLRPREPARAPGATASRRVPSTAAAPPPSSQAPTQYDPAPGVPDAAFAPPGYAGAPPRAIGSGPRAMVPVPRGGVRQGGEQIDMKADALHVVRHPVTIVALIALAILLVVKSVVHKDWYVTKQEAARACKERNLPLIIWRHGGGDPRKEEYKEKVLKDPEVKSRCVIYEWEVPGSPGSGEYGNLTIFKPPADKAEDQVVFWSGEKLPTVPELVEGCRKAGAQ